MMTTREIEIKVGGRIIGYTEIGDGTYRFVVETLKAEKESGVVDAMNMVEVDKKTCEDVFVLVEASLLSLNDKFMQYEPRTDREKQFKKLLTVVIRKGLKDFCRPKYNPSFNEDGTGIVFESGRKPAVGKSYNWWEKAASGFIPDRGSRLGTKSEYIAFLGVLIKQMVADGWSVEAAWNAVCNNSAEMGHYWNSENAKYDLEKTGSREVFGFFDLANTFKILAEDVNRGGFWLAGGTYYDGSDICPLAFLRRCTNRNFDYNYGVGWFVLSK